LEAGVGYEIGGVVVSTSDASHRSSTTDSIYALELVVKKSKAGVKAELVVHRAVREGFDFERDMSSFVIKAGLLSGKGGFEIRLNDLVYVKDETDINAPDAVVGPVRYRVAGVANAVL
jgi:hypothetical protein